MAQLERWVGKCVLGFGMLTAVGLAASATAAVTSSQLYDVAPVSPRNAGASGDGDDNDDPDAALASVSRKAAGNADLERRARKRREAVDTILGGELGRNTFCPTCVPATPDAPATPGAVFPTATTGPVLARLVATMEAEPVEASLATVYSADVGTRIVRIGDVLEGDAVVTSIGSGRLQYARGQGVGTLDINNPDPPAARPSQSPKPTGPKKPPGPAESDQIACKRPGECTVERSLVEDTLANPSALGGLRAFPSGEGFKIAGVRRGSLAHQLGLRSGDVLTEVNGRALDTVDAALKLLPALRNASNFSVSLQRKGKPLTHNVQII